MHLGLRVSRPISLRTVHHLSDDQTPFDHPFEIGELRRGLLPHVGTAVHGDRPLSPHHRDYPLEGARRPLDEVQSSARCFVVQCWDCRCGEAHADRPQSATVHQRQQRVLRRCDALEASPEDYWNLQQQQSFLQTQQESC